MTVSHLTALLKKCVANGQCDFLTYGEFGQRYGLGNYAPAWANRKTLDVAAQECKADPETGHLDLTFLLRNRGTGYPSVIDGRPYQADNPGAQIERARVVAQSIIDRFAPGTRNPY
ncbi:hypothetical protein QEZ48_09255 [Aquamicrobium lusatiense]|uniref:hypothetical protein n=1 Tax=Aquamicrobium lusatiense TaxID=89772 RepID=UPI0024550DE6|nr:hypothetical protein [Aquamicrobium lusatiense]MDH4991016.1 hypothetical protein [Aquamicrobium lusatiense]